MRFSLLGWSLAGLTAVAVPVTYHGLEIVVLETFPAGRIETTHYVAGDRARVERRISGFAGVAQQNPDVHIRRCDLGTLMVLNATDRTYQTTSFQTRIGAFERAALLLGRRDADSQGTPDLVVETTTVDTGERKIAFGYSARRVITTRREIHSGDSAPRTEIVTDGWYIDLETRPSCERPQPGTGRAVMVGVVSRADAQSRAPRVTIRDIGTPEDGFPIETTTTYRFVGREAPESAPTVAHRVVVTRLSRGSLDANLFEIPPGFRSADRPFSRLAERWNRTAHIIRAVVGSWFR